MKNKIVLIYKMKDENINFPHMYITLSYALLISLISNKNKITFNNLNEIEFITRTL